MLLFQLLWDCALRDWGLLVFWASVFAVEEEAGYLL